MKEERTIKRSISQFAGSSQPYGAGEKTIKRSIRIPSKLYEALVEDSRRVGRSSNQVVLDILRRGVWNRGRGEKERKKVVLICVFME